MKHFVKNMVIIKVELDCEQSLFFFRFSESSARAREGQSRETRETRAAASAFLRLQSRAWSFAYLARFARQTKEKERLLVV